MITNIFLVDYVRKQAIKSAICAGKPPPARKKQSIPPHMRTQALTKTAAARVAEAGAAETAAARAAETATQQVIIQFDIFFRILFLTLMV